MSDDKKNPIPGFGWVARLGRWANQDVDTVGQDGPLGMVAPQQHDRTDDLDSMSGTGGMLGMVGGQLRQFFSEPRTRQDLYKIYTEMDRTDIAGSVLDLISEDATQVDVEIERIVWVTTKDKNILRAADEMFKRLKFEENLPGIARDMAKMGDDFERTIYRSGPDGGVMRLVPVDPVNIVRKEDKHGKLEGYCEHGKKYRGSASVVSYPWDYAHFRIPGTDRRYGYGTSVLKNAIRPWRQMMILEDWMVNYQVSRHPDRNLFVVDVGESTEVEASDVARRFRQKLKRHMIVDPAGTSGKTMGYDFNPITPMEDMVLPVRKDSTTRIEKLVGSGNAADIAPLGYIAQKFFSAVRAPKGFFGMDDNAPGGTLNLKASLVDQDIRYARNVQKVQRSVKNGVTWLCELEFTLKMSGNADPERQDNTLDWTQQGKNFTVHMAAIAYLEELERLELLQLRQQVGVAFIDMARDHAAFKASEWVTYILREVIRVPEKEINKVLRTAAEMAAVQDAMLKGQGVNVAANVPIIPPQPEMGVQGEGMDDDTKKRIEDAVEAVRAKGVIPQGDLGSKDIQKLSEVLQGNKKLRNLIELGAMLWREESESENIVDTGGRALPDRRNKALFEKDGLTDSVSQEDLSEMMDEAADEANGEGA